MKSQILHHAKIICKYTSGKMPVGVVQYLEFNNITKNVFFITICYSSYYKSSSVCLFVCLSVCSLSPPRSFDRSSPNLVGVCRWTSELPLRGSFSKRSTARRVNGSLSLSTILYMCQPHSTQLQKATLLLLHLITLKGTFCCIDGWWVYVGGSRN